jgi:hypothetical protein
MEKLITSTALCLMRIFALQMEDLSGSRKEMGSGPNHELHDCRSSPIIIIMTLKKAE